MSKPKMPKEPKPTEEEWERLFEIRCKTKRGEFLSEGERELVGRTYRSDRNRYAAMEPRVFEATRPFGSKPNG